MVVILLERVPASLRGELTRWMIQPKTGVFVGKLSSAVRERLWTKVCSQMKGGAGTLIYSSDTEQGYVVRFWGGVSRWVVDFEGLKLIQKR